MILGEGTVEGHRLLSPESVRQMTTNHLTQFQRKIGELFLEARLGVRSLRRPGRHRSVERTGTLRLGRRHRDNRPHHPIHRIGRNPLTQVAATDPVAPRIMRDFCATPQTDKRHPKRGSIIGTSPAAPTNTAFRRTPQAVPAERARSPLPHPLSPDRRSTHRRPGSAARRGVRRRHPGGWRRRDCCQFGRGVGPDQQHSAGCVVDDEARRGAEAARSEPLAVAVAG